MRNTARTWLLSLLSVFIISNSFADKNPTVKSKPVNKSTNAELCTPASGSSELNLNNVRARINTGGDMWWDFKNARYFIPKNEKTTSMFSGSLWIGGVDVNGQLKLAALRYRQVGNDYWPGPLTTDNTASVNDEVCQKYDKHFPITRAEIEEFKAWYDEPASYPNYSIPNSIKDWPAHGDVSLKQSYYLAPFFDKNGDGTYNPDDGDYPYYDLTNALCKDSTRTAEGNGILADQVLKGDQTLWWVFNDKGNAHTETKGASIGLEIRAQAFAFATNDEVNNMTFYSYEIINRSTFTLENTYFSQWVDTDLGYGWDDYVGCDVLRGLGYCYNGKAVDGNGQPEAYGAQPPAVGVDFFQGPYMDPDLRDNPRFTGDCSIVNNEADACAINGVNFGDGIVDNERFGMRRFVYHNNTGGHPAMTDPDIAIDYYNLLRGIWKDGNPMMYGGNAHPSSTPPAYGPVCAFMFPGDTDPCDWGTGGLPPNGPKYWTEEVANNVPFDRRFMQSAGPFTLKPGAVNYITVGIPWARASSGGPFASVELLRLVDDKCQALFDNCFKVLDGPDAPDLVIQELDRELVLYISNRKVSNNYKEKYQEYDPNIRTPDSVTPDSHRVSPKIRYDSLYRFEGYQIYQLKDASVSIADISNPALARLVAQCDLKNFDKNGNPIAKLVNYDYSEALGGNIPTLKVDGANTGISHSFRITDDAFATGDKRLINNKQYYYIAISYAYNEYMKYSQEPTVLNGLYGQKQPYKAGRKSPTGSIRSATAIPHKVSPEAGGLIQNADYGDGPKIRRIEGQGNGGNLLDFTQESIDELMAKTTPPYVIENPEYENNKGPINIKVIDPLNVKSANYSLKFVVTGNNINTAKWILTNTDDNTIYQSDTTIQIGNEQLFVNEGLGFSVTIMQSPYPGDKTNAVNNGLIESSFVYADSSKKWLSGVPDIDGASPYNWIRSGTVKDKAQPKNNDYDMINDNPLDPEEYFEKILDRTWAPYRMACLFDNSYEPNKYGPALGNTAAQIKNKLMNIASVDIVLTSDKSKWSRCPVIEMCEDPILAEGNAVKFHLRKAPSVDKDGIADGTGTGMGWFPGYAINVETGERLNVMFGENSWLVSENGRDMLFNPTANYTSPLGTILWGGMHNVYVFGHNNLGTFQPHQVSPTYDEGQWAKTWIETANIDWVYAQIMYVGLPMAIADQEWLSNDVKLRIRMISPYKRYYATAADSSATPQNNNWPMYTFTTSDIATTKSNLQTAKEALDLINVVPNPYYAASGYEQSQIDNRVKITNLPDKCTISIYTVNGTLIRQLTKDDQTSTYMDWDLKNHAGIPISGGIYLIYVKVDGVGEKVIKWFGSMRPIDLNSF